MFNDPLLLAAMLAERRADLQRAATRSRLTPMNYRRRRLRGLVTAAVRRLKPAPTPAGRDALDELRDLELELEVMFTEQPVEEDRNNLDPVLV